MTPSRISNGEIYDVKSWNEMLAGMIKIQAYAAALHQADPDRTRASKWHAGLTYQYGGPNPYRMPGTSNGKQVWAVYYPTAAGVIPYKLFEVDDDNDRKRIPVPVMVPPRERDFNLEIRLRAEPLGNLIYANYYSRKAAHNVAFAATVGFTIA